MPVLFPKTKNLFLKIYGRLLASWEQETPTHRSLRSDHQVSQFAETFDENKSIDTVRVIG